MVDKDCPFCEIPRERVFAESSHLIAIKDRYPVTPGHILVVPKSHRDNYFALTLDEANDLYSFLSILAKHLQKEDASIDGFNVGMNCGESAGQTVFHCHIHLIPRRTGDVADPKGGVRGVIAAKQKYPSDS